MKPVTVTQLNEYIADKLRNDYRLRQLPVEGEISALSISGKSAYFSLKDAGSIIRCVIWAGNMSRIDMSLVKNGNKVTVIGDISPYAKGGYYSFSITHLEAAGEGELMAEFNRVKRKLEQEGIFDPKHKRPLPEFPYRVGVITSASGAAVEDIKKIIKSKNDFTDIIIFPTLVQGSGAPESICSSIRTANRISSEGFRIDTLIVGRGGGSPEDLAAFNDERVARAVFSSEIPVISAVGHESDFSICDFAADRRAETPTAAADMSVMDTFMLRDNIEELRMRLTEAALRKTDDAGKLLESRTELLYSAMKARLTEARNIIDKSVIIMEENRPDRIFAKGYAAVANAEGRIVPDAAMIEEGREYEIIMRDGSFIACAMSRKLKG